MASFVDHTYRVLLNAIHELPEVQSALGQSSDAIRGALSR